MARKAKKMVEKTRGKLHVAKEGECVAKFEPELNRGRGDPANIVDITLEIKNGKFRIGTTG